jgi:cyclophilin family peptidyl-prolyl cis-trans isomerase
VYTGPVCARLLLAPSARARSAVGSWRRCLLIVALAQPLALTGQRPADTDGQPHSEEETAHRLLLDTSVGAIEIELFETAAPKAVKRLRRLTRDGREAASSFYEGLAFDFTHPHVEIRTALPESQPASEWPAELDAESLGLDRKLVADYAEAMTIVQRELLVAHRKKKKSGQISEKLGDMLSQWYETHSAGFLIGVSHKEINEALGYEYQSDLDSRPAVRGAVMLEPVSPTVASARLSILLADIPARTGRWTVIGEVTRGLDVAQAISIRPRIKDRRMRYQPIEPIAIDRARLVRAEAGTTPP